MKAFESFVNSERCKTLNLCLLVLLRLRALLIQKDVKLIVRLLHPVRRLRALLIQKDVKQIPLKPALLDSLRALLIQKDVKH